MNELKSVKHYEVNIVVTVIAVLIMTIITIALVRANSMASLVTIVPTFIGFILIGRLIELLRLAINLDRTKKMLRAVDSEESKAILKRVWRRENIEVINRHNLKIKL